MAIPDEVKIGISVDDPNLIYNSRSYADNIKAGEGFGSVALDADGWPTGDFTVSICGGVNNTGTYGVYVDAYSADIHQGPGLTAPTPAPFVRDPLTGLLFTTVNVYQDSNPGPIEITNTRRNAGDTTATGVKSIAVMQPTDIGATTFVPYGTLWHPLDQNFCRPFAVSRFLDWASTNTFFGSGYGVYTDPPIEASSRPLPSKPVISHYDPLSVGVPAEHLIHWCNALGHDMWMAFPDVWSEAYCRKFIKIVFRGSDGVNAYTTTPKNPVWAPLKGCLYTTFTNEACFNYAFPQAQRTRNASDAEIASGNTDLVWNDNTFVSGNVTGEPAHWRYLCRGSTNLSIWCEEEIGRDAYGIRYRPCFDYQKGNTFMSLYGLSYTYRIAKQRGHETADQLIWGAGGSWYTDPVDSSITDTEAAFANPNYWNDDTWTVPELAGLQLPQFGNIRKVGYEGNTTQPTVAIGDDPRIQAITQRSLDRVINNGTSVAMVYNQLGQPWNTGDTIGNLKHPKWLGTVDRINFYGAGSAAQMTPTTATVSAGPIGIARRLRRIR